MSEEYRALVDKVAEFCASLTERRSAELSCKPGCSSCCHAWLSVCAVEREQLENALAALPSERRAQLAERGRRELAREQNKGSQPQCALLDPDGRCAVYEHRPLVCRTQGLALRYPAGVIPLKAVRARLATGDVTHCPLNFGAGVPPAQDVLDAERVDQLLGLVNLRFARARGADATARFAISAIAAGAARDAPGPS